MSVLMLRPIIEFAHRSLPAGSTSFIRRCIPRRLKSWVADRMISGIPKHQNVVSSDGRLFKPIDDGLFFRVFFEGVYEPELSAILAEYLEPSDHVIDVGGNFGWYSTLFGKRVPSGSVTAYEPMPRIFETLEENIRLNQLESVVRPVRACVGEAEGVVAMVQAANSGLAHVAKETEQTEKVSTPMLTLDQHVGHLANRLSLIKVHVEGFELNVLKGAELLLAAENQPVVQVKLNDERLADYQVDRRDIVDFLVRRSYEIFEVAPSGRVVATDGTRWVEMFAAGRGEFAERFKNRFVTDGGAGRLKNAASPK